MILKYLETFLPNHSGVDWGDFQIELLSFANTKFVSNNQFHFFKRVFRKKDVLVGSCFVRFLYYVGLGKM